MIPVTEIRTLLNNVNAYETEIDTGLFTHFNKSIQPYRYNFPYNTPDIVINKLLALYMVGGWKIDHKKGCDDRPCAAPYNYLEFWMP